MSDKENVSIGGFNITKYKKRAEAEKTLRQEYESEVSSKVLDSLCREFNGWLSYGDTDYLDKAVSLLYASKVPIKGVLLDEVGKLANARLSGEVKKSTGKRKKLIDKSTESLKTKKGRNKFFVNEPCVKNVFVLVNICGFYERSACFYAACINEKIVNTPIGKRITARGIRQLYDEFKKTVEYKLFINSLELYKKIAYPNMSNEEIESSITNGDEFCKDKFDYLYTDEFTRIKRN